MKVCLARARETRPRTIVHVHGLQICLLLILVFNVTGMQVDFATLSPHVVAALFKRFFRFLPEPVLTTYLQPEFAAAAELPEQQQRIDRIHALVMGLSDDDASPRLPEANRALLKYAVQLLTEVAHYSEVNEMDAQSLAAIFATLFGREASAVATHTSTDSNAVLAQNLTLVVRDMIENYSLIFTLL
jgi:hypothetical protein